MNGTNKVKADITADYEIYCDIMFFCLANISLLLNTDKLLAN